MRRSLRLALAGWSKSGDGGSTTGATPKLKAARTVVFSDGQGPPSNSKAPSKVATPRARRTPVSAKKKAKRRSSRQGKDTPQSSPQKGKKRKQRTPSSAKPHDDLTPFRPRFQPANKRGKRPLLVRRGSSFLRPPAVVTLDASAAAASAGDDSGLGRSPSKKRTRLDVTLEDGEIPGGDGEQGEPEVQPLFVLDTTGDPDAMDETATPEVLLVKEVPAKSGAVIRRGNTPKRTCRFDNKKKDSGKKNKAKGASTAGRVVKAVRGALKRGKNRSFTTPSPKSKRVVVQMENPFFDGDDGGRASSQPPPPSPASVLRALHYPPRRPFHFDPRRPVQTDFASSEQEAGGVFHFTAPRSRQVPSMGVRQASRSALRPPAGIDYSQQQQQQQAGGGLDNVYVPQDTAPFRPRRGDLRPIIIDGSNVAMAHARSHGRTDFSSRGIDLVVDHFVRRGHAEVFAVVPQSRREVGRARDRHVLERLERQGRLVFTPARRLDAGRGYTMYDDRYIVQYSALRGAVMVSNDNYRDLMGEGPEMRDAIQHRLLMFTFMPGDCLMFPQDPLGKGGPSLEEFLRF